MHDSFSLVTLLLCSNFFIFFLIEEAGEILGPFKLGASDGENSQ